MAPSKIGKTAFRVTSDAPDTVAVSGNLNFATAANVLAALRTAFERGDRRVLDLSGVTSCDSAGLACVLAALAETDRKGCHIATRQMPDGMRSLAQVCGVEPLLH
jgi:phospholipid transport system transporter-binding protein